MLKLIVNCLPLIFFDSRIRKKIYKFSSSGSILHTSAKLQGGICKTSYWLTENFDGWDKLINVVQFQKGNWSFVNVRRIIDETCNFKGIIAYSLDLNFAGSLTCLN